MNDMMNPRRCRDRNDRRIEDEELGNPFFEGDCSSSNEWGDYGVAGDDYEGALVFDDNYQEAPVFDDDQLEEPMQVYDTDIEDVIEEEERFVRKGGFGRPYKGVLLIKALSQLEYSRVIGCLMYAMTCTRSDIAFAVGKLSSTSELIMNRVVSIEFVRSQQNLAEHLTKGLDRDLVLKSPKGMRLKSNIVTDHEGTQFHPEETWDLNLMWKA
ncbi:hypothetical protein Tco_0715928 [Tanacetum coccineum]